MKIEIHESGQSLVELAISFLVIVLLLAATVDLGRLFFSYISLREAAEEGAAYGSYNPGDTSGIEARSRDSSNSPVDLADSDSVAVDIVNFGDPCAGNNLQVTVTYNYNLTMPLIGIILGTQQFPISASAISTVLTPPCP